MEVIPTKVFNAPNRDLYWARIDFISDDRNFQTRVLACVSLEYLEDFHQVRSSGEINESHLGKWLDDVIKKWTNKGLSIFNQERHYDVYSILPEGEVVGQAFLNELS